MQLGDASGGSDYEIQANCDGNPIMAVRANLVLSDEASPAHQPSPDAVDDYVVVYDTVCAASARAAPFAMLDVDDCDLADALGGMETT